VYHKICKLTFIITNNIYKVLIYYCLVKIKVKATVNKNSNVVQMIKNL